MGEKGGRSGAMATAAEMESGKKSNRGTLTGLAFDLLGLGGTEGGEIWRCFPNGTDGGEGAGRSGATATAAEMETEEIATEMETEEHLLDWSLTCLGLAGTKGGEEQEDRDVADRAGWELSILRRLERTYPGTKGMGTKGRISTKIEVIF